MEKKLADQKKKFKLHDEEHAGIIKEFQRVFKEREDEMGDWKEKHYTLMKEMKDVEEQLQAKRDEARRKRDKAARRAMKKKLSSMAAAAKAENASSIGEANADEAEEDLGSYDESDDYDDMAAQNDRSLSPEMIK